MATFTVTTPQNIDALTSKAGGDTYNINGGTLTIDQDSRYGTNQTTSASLGPVTLSATLGGTVEVDARFVRLIPYNTGTGNVPASGTTISRSGASGTLIGVWSAISSAPTAAGAAMPASGFIKIKAWNSVAFTSGALTGISASATGPDVVGWIELVGDEASTITVNRLNLFRMRGDWFEVGTTSGSNATTYQLPTSGSNMYLPGVYVETGTSTGIYEFYPCAGSLTALLANVETSATKGKLCWISTAGLVRFQNDGTNSTGGYLPPSGRKIRIPNIITQNCTTASRTTNALPKATLATRYDFTTSGGGVISIDKANLNWFPSFAQPFSVTLSDVSIMTQLSVSEIASPVTWSNTNVGQEAANTNFALLMSLCFAGGTVTDCNLTRATLGSSGHYVNSLTDIDGFTFTRFRSTGLVARGNATTGNATLTRVSNCTFTDCNLNSGRQLLTTCTNLTYTNTGYFDTIGSTTATAQPMYMFDLASNCNNVKIDGVHFNGTALNQPYSGILQVGAAGCTNIKLRNLGTYASPLDLGGARLDGITWTRSTTTATITSTAHGLKTNDIIYVIVSSDTAAITVASKTVTVTGVNTFTFTCLNAGAASGTLSYYPTMSANLFVLATGAAANNVKIQRCYTPHTRTNLFTADNSSKNIVLENVYGDYISAPVVPALNAFIKGVGSSQAMTAQTACYGTHWFDGFLSDPTPNRSSQSWSRTTTTATVTSNGHNLRTGQLINVTVSSATAAIVLGQKTVTVTGVNTFTFTCLNAGATSGTLSFNPLTSRVGLLMNEATSDTTGQYTIDAGGTAFTSAGGLYMPAVNDQITFETPNYIIGHTSFPIAEAVMTGGTIANYAITYAIDKKDGSGYSSFHNLYYGRAGGSGTNGQTTFTVTDATGVEVDDYVFGTNIAPNAKVTDVNGNTITVDTANTGTVSGTIRFAHLPSETSIDASKGFKLKIRIKTVTTNATAITSLLAYSDSDATSRAYTYPLDLVNVTLTGLKNPSEVRIFDAGTTTEIDGSETITTGTFTTQLDATTYPDVDVSVLSLGYQNTRYLGQVLGSGLTIPVSQVVDRQYLNP